MSGNGKKLEASIHSLQLNIEGLLQLLGGSAADRERYWGIVKGITTPAVLAVVEAEIEAQSAAVHAMRNSINALHTNAKALSEQ